MPKEITYAEIVKRMRLEFPLTVSLVDPLTGEPITLSRENVLALLVIDRDNPELEAQTVSALYGEMARFRRAAEAAAASAETSYRKWKSQMGHKLREKRKKDGEKAPTVAEVEAHYRGHKDYELMANEPSRLQAIAGLLGDLMWSFKMKAEMMADLNRMVGGHAATERHADYGSHVDPSERLEDYASMAAEVAEIVSRSQSIEDAQRAAQEIAQQPVPPPPSAPSKSKPKSKPKTNNSKRQPRKL